MNARPLTAEARGRLRLLWVELASDANRITTAAERLPPPMLMAAVQKSAVGARHALANVRRRIPAPAQSIWCGTRGAAWRFLKPVSLPDDVGLSHPAIMVTALLLGAANRPVLTTEPFGLCFTELSLGRLLDRTSFKADPIDAMLAAHDHLLQLNPEEGRKIFALQRLALPAGPGTFLVRPQARSDTPMAACITWVNEDQTFEDQDRDVAAWKELASLAAATGGS